MLKGTVESVHLKLQQRLEKSVKCQFDLNMNKISILDQIDKFFEIITKQVEKRKESLKNEYIAIESREKRRLKNKQIKLQKELTLVEEFKTELDEFIQDFDVEMDNMANEASFQNTYKLQFQEILQEKINRRSDNDIFSRSEFKLPTFCQSSAKDLQIIDEIGKIVDNSDFSMPLVVFNTQQLQAFSFQEHLREFKEVDIIDEENLSQLEVPRYFKSLYIPDDKFLLLGGLERHTSHSSARVF